MESNKMSNSTFTLELGGRQREVRVIDPASNRLKIKNANVSGLVLTAGNDGDERHFTYNQLKEAQFAIAAEEYGLLSDGVDRIQSKAKQQRHAVDHEPE